MLKRNGYVLEQALSPIIVITGPEHEELAALAGGCPTVHHAHHYLGFLQGQIREAERKGTIKALLYGLRVAPTGIWLMRTGEVEANLPRLATLLHSEIVDPLDLQVDELIARKTAGGERALLAPAELDAWRDRLATLGRMVEEAQEQELPPPANRTSALRRGLDAFVRRTRSSASVLR